MKTVLPVSLADFGRAILLTLAAWTLSMPGEVEAQFTDTGRWQSAQSGSWGDSINWQNGHVVNGWGAYAAFRAPTGLFRTTTLDTGRAVGYFYFEPGDNTTIINGNGHNFYLNSNTFLPVIDAQHHVSFIGTVQFATGFRKIGSKSVTFEGTTWNSFDAHRTYPVWIDQGGIFLSKGAGRDAIGSTIVNGGSLTSYYDEQIDNYAYIQVRTGSLSIRNETITSLSFGGWGGSWSYSANGQVTLTGADGYLYGGSTSHPFSLSILGGANFNQTNFRFTAPAGSSSGGGLYVDANTSFSNSIFDLGGQTRYWYVADNAWLSLTGTSTISNGGLYKYGGGTLELAGTSANSISQDTVVDGGWLVLNKSPGVNAIGGNLHIYGGTVNASNTQQLPDNSHVYAYPGANLYLQNETLGSLYWEGNSMGFGQSITFTGFSPIMGASNASFVLMTNSGWYGGTDGATMNFFAPAGGGGFYSLYNASFNNINFNLGGQVRTFSLQGDFVDIYGNSVVSNGGLDIWGNLYLGGTQANNLTLTTRLNSGWLGLYKTNNVNAVGDLIVESGTVYSYTQNQIADNATVTQNGGAVYFNNETLGRFVHNGGSFYTIDGLPLTLTSTQQFALDVKPGTGMNGLNLKFTGASGGGMRFNHTGSATSWIFGGSIDFGGVNREINVGSGDFGLGNIAMSNGGFTKTGAGRLFLYGDLPNANTGTTIVNAGELWLSKNANVNSIGGDLIVNGGAVYSGGQNQIADNATVTLNGGSIQFNNETVGRFIANGGSFSLVGGPLTLTSTAQYALQIPSGSTLSGGAYRFTGASGGGIRLNPNSAEFSTWNSLSIDLGNRQREIHVAQGYVAFNNVAIANGGVLKTGVGWLVLNGAATYAGGTVIQEGALYVLNTTGSATGSGKVTIASKAVLTGNGSIAGTVIVEPGGRLSPGLGVGKISLGNLAWKGSGNYRWQLLDAAGTAGVGYDTIQIAGILDLNASRGVQIDLWTVQNASGASGLAANFNSSVARSWLLASAAGGIFGWDPEDFRVNLEPFAGTGGFQNPLDGGRFQVRTTAMQLWLDFLPFGHPGGPWLTFGFTPTPEPSAVLAFCGLAGLIIYRLRRSKSGSPRR